jgi:hypothetical protein
MAHAAADLIDIQGFECDLEKADVQLSPGLSPLLLRTPTYSKTFPQRSFCINYFETRFSWVHNIYEGGSDYE